MGGGGIFQTCLYKCVIATIEEQVKESKYVIATIFEQVELT